MDFDWTDQSVKNVRMEIIFIFFALFHHYCSGSTAWDLKEALKKYNEELRVIQHQEAQIAWNISLGEDPNAWGNVLTVYICSDFIASSGFVIEKVLKQN